MLAAMSRWLVFVAVALVALLGWWWPRDLAPPDRGEAAATPDAGPKAPVAASAPRAAASAADATESQRVALAIDHQLRGRVVDEAGQPVGGVPVHLATELAASPQSLLRRAQRGDYDTALASSVTAADGTFHLAIPAAAVDAELQVHALPERHGDASLRHVRRTGATTALPDLVVRAERPVRVLVIDDATEQPIVGATVTAHPVVSSRLRLPGREHGRRAVTDGEGSCTLFGLPAGNWTFRGEAAGHATSELPQQAVQASEPTEILIALAAGFSLGGHVVDVAGRPVAGAFVEARSLAGHAVAKVANRTDERGHFELTGLAAGELRLTIGKAGLRTTVHEPVAAGSARHVFTLRPQGAIRLTVLEANGVPRASFAVTARPVGPAAGLRQRPRRAVAAAEVHDGAFLVDDLDPGAWMLTVEAPGWSATSSGAIEVGEGTVVDARVVLQAGATLRLRILGGSPPRPAAGARVTTQPDGFLDGPAAAVLAPLSAASTGSVTTVANGAGVATLAHVPAGTWQLRIDVARRAPFYVRSIPVGDLDIDLGAVSLPKTEGLYGSVRVEDAVDPAVVVQVLALAGGNLPAGYRVEAAVDAAGNWRCAEALPAGRYALMAGRRQTDDPFRENQDAAASRVEIELDGSLAERRVDLVVPRRGS
jgi:Carboxypeptidase regulatory-like domain